MEKNLRFILFLDDFHLLHRYRLPSGRRAVDLLPKVIENQSEVFYVATVSPSPFVDRYFIAEGGPFHTSFQFYPVEALPKDAAVALAEKVLGTGGESANRVAKLSARFPLYVTEIAKAAKRGGEGRTPSPQDVDRAFTAQVLLPWGAIYRHFEHLLRTSLRVKDDLAPAKAILSSMGAGKRVAKETLALVSGREGKALGDLLGRILSLGLFRRVENTYYFEDPLFRFWAVRTQERGGKAPDHFTGSESTQQADAFLKDFLPLHKETPLTPKKFNFRALVAGIKGMDVPGKWMGTTDPVTIPVFDRVQGFAFSSKEIKVYYLSGEAEGWILLVVWRPVPIDPRLIEIFAHRALDRAHGLWFVGRGGFTPEALDFARTRGIYCSSEGDLEKLMEVAAE
ncbi:MAG: ATP-binding protein [Planctomycetota bacterium]